MKLTGSSTAPVWWHAFQQFRKGSSSKPIFHAEDGAIFFFETTLRRFPGLHDSPLYMNVVGVRVSNGAPTKPKGKRQDLCTPCLNVSQKLLIIVQMADGSVVQTGREAARQEEERRQAEEERRLAEEQERERQMMEDYEHEGWDDAVLDAATQDLIFRSDGSRMRPNHPDYNHYRRFVRDNQHHYRNKGGSSHGGGSYGGGSSYGGGGAYSSRLTGASALDSLTGRMSNLNLGDGRGGKSTSKSSSGSSSSHPKLPKSGTGKPASSGSTAGAPRR